ncbi:hypothetical protein GCM10009740_17380 [Terrabacter terrae]|uniref:Threonine transporter n=2 Tax=Terrabacter terrae TaxID=318434 RepID=A0ABP5FK08_9MICO
MQPLNSPIELGLRCVVLLTSLFPRRADISRLVLMDHCLLHSADLGGPDSVLPPIPARGGELGIKRTVVEHGLRVMMRAGMVEAHASEAGLEYAASEEAESFLGVLESSHLRHLIASASWVVEEFGDQDESAIRDRVGEVLDRWSEDLEPIEIVNESLLGQEDER